MTDLNNKDKWFPQFRALVSAGKCDVVRDYHSVFADLYDYMRDDPKNEAEFYQSLVPYKGSRVLELGCGSGCLSIPVAQKCDYFLGIDSSEDLLRIFKKKIRKKAIEKKIEIRHGDFTDFSRKKDGVFDLVYIPYNTIVHVIRQKKKAELFNKVATVLKPGGSFVVDLWIPNRIVNKTKKLMEHLKTASGDWILFSEISVEKKIPRRFVNILAVHINSIENPVATTFEEHIYRRAEIRRLFKTSGFRVRMVTGKKEITGGRRERCIYIGTL